MQAEITSSIEAAFPDADIDVQLDGNRAVIAVVSSAFAGMTRVKQQQAVYACINEYIADGRLHAVTIQAAVPSS